MLGLGLSIPEVAVRARSGGWSPASLFAGGAPGYWAGDRNPAGGRLWQNNTGTIPTTSYDQAVGRELDRSPGGYHATQATTLSQPTLARWPRGGRRNLLTWTEDLNNAAWIKFGGASVGHIADDVWSLNAASSDWVFYRTIPETMTNTVRLSVDVLASAPGQKLRLFTGGSYISGDVSLSQSVWTRVTYSGPNTGSRSAGMAADVAGSGVDVLIRRPQAEVGDATPYQRVTTANDVSEVGVPDVWHLYNDGGDSLNVVLPAGTYGRARVSPACAIDIDTIVSDGTTATNVVPVSPDRQADVILRLGALTPEEQALITTYWATRYAA